jgi:hypothetical protein
VPFPITPRKSINSPLVPLCNALAGCTRGNERKEVLIVQRTQQATQFGTEQPERQDERQPETETAGTVVTTPEFDMALVSLLQPFEVTPTTLTEVTGSAPAVGSRAEVIFGRNEHIALARVRNRSRRKGGCQEMPRRRIPISEREIPSLVEGDLAVASEQNDYVQMPSLWDLLVAPTSHTSTAASTLFADSSLDQQTPTPAAVVGTRDGATPQLDGLRGSTSYERGEKEALPTLSVHIHEPHAPACSCVSSLLGHGGFWKGAQYQWSLPFHQS